MIFMFNYSFIGHVSVGLDLLAIKFVKKAFFLNSTLEYNL